MTQNKCTRCKYDWYQRTEKTPDVCPSCKSKYWNKERVYPIGHGKRK